MPKLSNVQYDKVLTNLSVRYSNSEYIAEKVFPSVEVAQRNGKYFVYDKSNLRIDETERTGRSESNEVDFELSQSDYGPLKEHSVKHFIEEDLKEQADDPYDALQDGTEFLAEKMAIRKEKTLADMLADTAVVTQNTTLSGTDQWSDYANSDPFGDVQTAHDTIVSNGMKKANTAVMSWTVFAKLIHHPDLLERVKYSERGVLTEELLASLFNVEQIYVGMGSYNTAVQGQSASLSYIWGKHFILMYVERSPGLKRISAGYHLTLKNARKVTRWDENDPEGTYIKNKDYYEPKMVAAEAVYLIKNAVA